jgi:hypothetical protein
MPTARRRFDADYFRRYYGGEERVHSPAEIARLASGIVGVCGWLGLELESVLDVGAGAGLWRSWFRRRRPAVRYRSIDVSAYACERFGHERRDISRWCGRERYDLVVCHSVLQYLGARAASRAIEHLGRMCKGVLYLEAIAAEDLAILDPELTDPAMHFRDADWYRRRLARHFTQIGAGLWASRRSGILLYALEGAGSPPRQRQGGKGPNGHRPVKRAAASATAARRTTSHTSRRRFRAPASS